MFYGGTLYFKHNSCSSHLPITYNSVLPAHMHQAESTRWQGDSQTTPELWVLSMRSASSRPSGAQNLEVAARVLEDCWSLVLTIIMNESL